MHFFLISSVRDFQKSEKSLFSTDEFIVFCNFVRRGYYHLTLITPDGSIPVFSLLPLPCITGLSQRCIHKAFTSGHSQEGIHKETFARDSQENAPVLSVLILPVIMISSAPAKRRRRCTAGRHAQHLFIFSKGEQSWETHRMRSGTGVLARLS